jgi:hypothetical protein
MSDPDEAPDEGDDEAADPDEESDAADAPEDQPAIEDDEMADLDAVEDLADEVEEEAGAEGEDEDQDTDTGDSGDTTADPLGGAGGGDSWGDLYVQSLTGVSNALIEEYGKAGADPISEDVPRSLALDEYAERTAEKFGAREDIPPEKALALNTTLFVFVVIAAKTDIPQDALSGNLDLSLD